MLLFVIVELMECFFFFFFLYFSRLEIDKLNVFSGFFEGVGVTKKAPQHVRCF